MPKRDPYLRDASAVLYHLSYQANCVLNIGDFKEQIFQLMDNRPYKYMATINSQRAIPAGLTNMQVAKNATKKTNQLIKAMTKMSKFINKPLLGKFFQQNYPLVTKAWRSFWEEWISASRSFP